MSSPDYFSRQGAEYKSARPCYPSNMTAYLASLCDKVDLAWDCATGNGQAAKLLANDFKKVIGTDTSSQLINLASKAKNIEYRIEPAESPTLPNSSVDLITIASAIHWLDHEKFYEQARKISKKEGIIAFWMYGWPIITKEIDELRQQYLYTILDGYWDERSKHWHARYETIPFPFKEITSPKFEITCSWSMEQIIAFLKSSSAAQVYMDTNGYHPIEHVKQELLSIDHNKLYNVSFPIYLRIGWVNK